MKRGIGFIFGLVLICVLVGAILVNLKKDNTEELKFNLDKKFEVSMIQYYSNASANSNNTSYQNPEWNLNIYQYTDIAIYLKRINQNDNDSYIKKVFINNINLEKTKKGINKLYYLNPFDFGKEQFYKENEIIDSLNYNIINSENAQNDVSYGIPVFFEDFSNPVTLKYVNTDIIKNYKVNSTEILSFDGSILKQAKIRLEDIQSKINFDINVITTNDEIHTVSLSLDIPLENDNVQIYEDSIDKKDTNLNIEF